MQELSGVSVWPKGRINANRKAQENVKLKEQRELENEIRKRDGDINEAEESIKQKRRHQFEEAIRIKKLNQLKKGSKL